MEVARKVILFFKFKVKTINQLIIKKKLMVYPPFLEGKALLKSEKEWKRELYRPIDSKNDFMEFEIRLVPYFV